MNPVFIDLETQSVADITEVGARRYIFHPTTRLACLTAKIDGAYVHWVPPGRAPDLGFSNEFPEALDEAARVGRPFVAHNAFGFDAPAYAHLMRLHPQPVRWIDTLPLAKSVGLPGGLESLGKVFLGAGKDPRGKRLINLLCKATVAGGEIRYSFGTKVLWQAMLEYNQLDVDILVRVYEEIKHLIDNREEEVLRVDRIINDRGIYVDMDRLAQLQVLWREYMAERATAVTTITGGLLRPEDLRSEKKVKAWFRSVGRKVESLEQKYTDQRDDFTEIEKEVLDIRRTLTRAAPAKLNAIVLAMGDDLRLRDMLNYFAAHTGRWGGYRVQLQNLASGVPIDYDAFFAGPQDLAAVKSLGRRPDDVLTALLRPVFCAPPGMVLGIADYNAIEARCVAWLAGEDKLLAAFREGRDVYSEFGREVLYGRSVTKLERQVAKTCILGMQYGMSACRFGESCHEKGVDLAGISTAACVEAYRSTYHRIPTFWNQVNVATLEACRGTPSRVGRVSFYHDGAHLYVNLPSSRQLVYRQARIERRVPGYVVALNLRPFEVDTVVYRHPKGFDKELYGGKITENISQAICRDILAEALVRLENEGEYTVLHVHDEIVNELERPENLSAQCRVMSVGPGWAKDFPIRVEGHTSPFYTKAPGRDSLRCVYQDGERIS